MLKQAGAEVVVLCSPTGRASPSGTDSRGDRAGRNGGAPLGERARALLAVLLASRPRLGRQAGRVAAVP
jgi:hypothetical protein